MGFGETVIPLADELAVERNPIVLALLWLQRQWPPTIFRGKLSLKTGYPGEAGTWNKHKWKINWPSQWSKRALEGSWESWEARCWYTKWLIRGGSEAARQRKFQTPWSAADLIYWGGRWNWIVLNVRSVGGLVSEATYPPFASGEPKNSEVPRLLEIPRCSRYLEYSKLGLLPV